MGIAETIIKGPGLLNLDIYIKVILMPPFSNHVEDILPFLHSMVLWLHMSILAAYLPYIQIILSALIIVCVLMQRTGASLGGAFGADNFGSGFHTRRGLERSLFYATIILGILFAISALLNLLIS